MRSMFLMVFACLLTACAQQSQVRLYPGEALPQKQLMTVAVPYELEVQSINGQSMPLTNSLFGTSYNELHLQPGQYQINVYYKEVFSLYGGQSHEVVHSSSNLFSIDGTAGDVWTLEFDKPANLDEARKLRGNFNSWAVNSRTGERVDAEISQPNRSEAGVLIPNLVIEKYPTVAPLNTAVATDIPNAQPTSQVTSASLSHNDATLITVQQLWRLMGEDSRAAFLDWIAQ